MTYARIVTAVEALTFVPVLSVQAASRTCHWRA
jgi:hypothetical protein